MLTAVSDTLFGAASSRNKNFYLSENLFKEAIDRGFLDQVVFEAFILAALVTNELESAEIAFNAARRNSLANFNAYTNFILVAGSHNKHDLISAICIDAIKKFSSEHSLTDMLSIYNPFMNSLVLEHKIKEAIRWFSKIGLYKHLTPLKDGTYNFTGLSFGTTYIACHFLMTKSKSKKFIIILDKTDAAGIYLFIKETKGSVKSARNSDDKITCLLKGSDYKPSMTLKPNFKHKSTTDSDISIRNTNSLYELMEKLPELLKKSKEKSRSSDKIFKIDRSKTSYKPLLTGKLADEKLEDHITFINLPLLGSILDNWLLEIIFSSRLIP